MIKRFIFGNPIETDAVLKKPKQCKDKFPILEKTEGTFFYQLDAEDIIYGLGEAVRGINKRGWIYESNCADDPKHLETKHSLYGAHNFLIVSGKKTFGLFVDTPGKVTFDIGYSSTNEMKIIVEEVNLELYIIEGRRLEEIVVEFRKLIGKSYVPPKWAFGYGQSRWSYKSADEVRKVVTKHKENKIPIDSIYLDIDYMKAYKDFTVDEISFPKFASFVKEMREEGIHLVPIIDAGVKIEKGYDVYEEGVKKNYFCKDEKGNDFVVGVWPGRCHFPDVLNAEARKWFGEKYKFLLDQGIDGFWNDMNEPAIFYSEDRIKRLFEKIQEYQSMNLDIRTFFEFQNGVSQLANHREDYQSFYHNVEEERIRHDKVHNLFGYYMTRAASEAFDRLRPEKRTLMFSRASYIGMHRYGGIWTGDNCSWWSHILLNLKMMPSLNMCGFLYSGADIGGFGEDATRDLLLRWFALGIFTPLLRNHSAMGTRRQEVYEFEEVEAFREMISLRYRLIPYLYSEFMKAVGTNSMYCKPLGFVFEEDRRARRVEDQVMIGESIMIAPVYEQNSLGRYVYLPEEMKLLKFRGSKVVEERILKQGDYYIEVGIEEVVIFIRKGFVLPLAKSASNIESIDYETLSIYHFAPKGMEYALYNDDGESKDVDLERNCRRIVVI